MKNKLMLLVDFRGSQPEAPVKVSPCCDGTQKSTHSHISASYGKTRQHRKKLSKVEVKAIRIHCVLNFDDTHSGFQLQLR